MIKRFEEFNRSIRLPKMNEEKNVTFNELEKLDKMKAGDYLRNVMWDHSIKLFYGKDYKGNPESETRMIPSVSASSTSRDISMGDVFKDAWTETDDFCNFASREFIFSFGDAAFSQRIQKTITTLDPNVVMEWIKGASIKVSKSDPSIFVVPTSMEDSARKIAIEASKFFQKRTVKVDSLVSDCAKRIANRDQEIKIIKARIENEKDFEPDWGLDSWIDYVTEMPGWGKVYQVEANKIGYWYSWTIAATVLDLTEIKFGVAIMKAVQSMIKAGQLNQQEINTDVTAAPAQMMPSTQQPASTPVQSAAVVKPSTAKPSTGPSVRKYKKPVWKK
jgi:hypothetical protein